MGDRFPPPHSPHAPEAFHVFEHGEGVSRDGGLPTITIPTRAPQAGAVPIPGFGPWLDVPVQTDPAAESPIAVVVPGSATGTKLRRLVFFSRVAGRLSIFPPATSPNAQTVPSAVFHVGPGGFSCTLAARASASFASFPTGAPAARINVQAALAEVAEPSTTEGVVLEEGVVPAAPAAGVLLAAPPQGCVECYVGSTVDATVTLERGPTVLDSYVVLGTDQPLPVGPLPPTVAVRVTAAVGAGHARASFRVRW